MQLWHRNNYYWYLKEEISPRLGRQAPITSLLWHPENALELYIATKGTSYRLESLRVLMTALQSGLNRTRIVGTPLPRRALLLSTTEA